VTGVQTCALPIWQSEEYPEAVLGDDAPQKPHTHYGVFKRANEGTAGIYWQDDGLASVGLRPFAVYGPGRDQGLTSAPTRAMLAAAAGRPYHIPYGGRGAYQYAEDAARVFIRAARATLDGARVFNMRGSAVHMLEIIEAIESVEPASKGLITFDDKPLPFPEDLDDAGLQAALGPLTSTPLHEGVQSTIAIFKRALAEGRLSAPSIV
jgi:UDP-glucuronate 4-epimerase